MMVLNTQLASSTISSAKGVDLAMRREELGSTLPKGKSGEQSAAGANTQQTAATRAAKALSPEQQRQVDQLQKIDRNVRAHEQAHIAAGRGVVTSGPSYSYTYGPDGKPYATAGEVGIDTAAEEKPEANIDKGQRIQAAALAPRDPSPQDYHVASIGDQLVTQGRRDSVEALQAERRAQEQQARQQREESASQGWGSAQAKANEYANQARRPAAAGRINLFA